MVIFVFLILFRIALIDAVYTFYEDSKTFSEALTTCNDTGQDMLTISNWEEYTNSLNHSDMLEVSWLGVERMGQFGEYRWISNGKILTELTWAPGQPGSLPCTYINIPNDNWYTDFCTESHNYVCVKNSNDYVVGPDKVNYSIAMERCTAAGGRLPVMITKQDRRDFRTAVLAYNSNTGIDNVWLGLLAVDGYYKWITGEDLTPPYNWADGGREQYVHYHNADHNDAGYHSDNKDKKVFVCQTRVSDVPEAVIRNPNHFDRVVTNKLVLGDVMYADVGSNAIECASVCSLNPSCVRFVQSGSRCEHFDQVSYTNVKISGFSFWEKTSANRTSSRSLTPIVAPH